MSVQNRVSYAPLPDTYRGPFPPHRFSSYDQPGEPDSPDSMLVGWIDFSNGWKLSGRHHDGDRWDGRLACPVPGTLALLTGQARRPPHRSHFAARVLGDLDHGFRLN